MADEKRNDQEIIVDKNELSEQDLDQASGGIHVNESVREREKNRNVEGKRK